MTVNVEKNNGLCKLQIEGEMTIFTAAELKKEIFEKIEACSEVEMNLSRVSEMDTAGLQILFLVQREVMRLNKSFRVASYSPAVLSALELLRIDLDKEIS